MDVVIIIRAPQDAPEMDGLVVSVVSDLNILMLYDALDQRRCYVRARNTIICGLGKVGEHSHLDSNTLQHFK